MIRKRSWKLEDMHSALRGCIVFCELDLKQV